MSSKIRTETEQRAPWSRQPRLAPSALGLVAAALASAALWSQSAHAQRGEAYSLKEELNVRPSPDRGFPGVFDTELVRPGAFVANLPLTSLYYGVTRELTLGTVLLSYWPVTHGNPSGSLHARYRLGSTSWFRSSADVLLFGQRTHSEDSGRSLFGVALLGNNTQFALTRWQQLTLNGWFGHVAEHSAGGNNADANLMLLGGTYSLVFAGWGAVHLTGLYLAAGNFAADSYGGAVDLELGGAGLTSDRLVARGTLSLRAGSWLFNLGGARVGSVLVPWANVAVEMGG